MKKIFLILCCVIVTNFSICLGQYYHVCIDPGHGGIDSGAVARTYGTIEKDANLSVGLALVDSIVLDIGFGVTMTRWTDTSISLRDRAEWAKHANNGDPVLYFISVHQNGFADTSVNGTETYYCNAEYTDSGEWRGLDVMYGARDSTFAKKVRLKLRDYFDYTYRCSPQHLCGDTTEPCCMACWSVVLRNTTMPSVLSEAAFITKPLVDSQFYYNTGIVDQEAGAIYQGLLSSYQQGGIAIIKNAYSTGNDCGYEGIVGVGDYPWTIDTFPSPYEACWLVWEWHCLEAFTPQYIDGYWYTFHHWTHLLPSGEPSGEDSYDSVWCIGVPPEFDYHRYMAYLTGGPYSAEVLSPNGYETWHVAEQETIKWDASVGADSTTWVYVYLDRNGGNDGYPEYLGCQEAKLANYLPWTVTGPVSAHCKIKIVAEDAAENSASDESEFDFNISGEGNNNPLIDGHLQCKYPYEECNECINWGESFWLEIEAHDPDGDSIYYEWYCHPFMGGQFSNGENTMTTAENCVEYFAADRADNGGKQSDDFLMVTVVDVRGGSNDTTGWLGLYDPETSCICGDVLANGIVDSGDIVKLIAYVFLGESLSEPTEEPTSRLIV